MTVSLLEGGNEVEIYIRIREKIKEEEGKRRRQAVNNGRHERQTRSLADSSE
jgi:hypothetical protein